MNAIKFISAGAGSGKTYRLTSILSEALRDKSNPVRPEAVIATTFTVKAATELRERVRDRLLGDGRLDLVSSIGQARIGTVNAVCGQLLQRFCFEVGISPDQTILSEEHAGKLLKTAIDDALDARSRANLAQFQRRFSIEDGDWSLVIGKIVSAARANDISADALAGMGKDNADLMLGNWPKPESDVDHTARLRETLLNAEAQIRGSIESRDAKAEKVNKNERTGLEKLHSLLRAFSGNDWTWANWLGACKVEAGAKAAATLQPVNDAGQAHERHPEFHRDVREYLDLVFGLAAKTLLTYEQAKLEMGAVDFSDQEVLLLRALQESEQVRSALRGELDLVLVDEFQDTSPLQLALFVELAKISKKSVWVGDPKQAIYGFRGTDASLVAGVIAALPDWGGELGEALTTSRRSTPALVSLANAVFIPAFAPDLPPEAVKLNAYREDIPGQPTLYNWSFESSRNDLDFDGLGPTMTQLLASGRLVADKDGTLRQIRPGDVAVLCRQHVQVAWAVAALSQWGIPVASPRAGLLQTPEALLVLACLRRMHDASDTAATALILALADGMAPDEWLKDRLDHLDAQKPSHEWKAVGDDIHPLVSRLEAARPALLSLTPSEALRLAVAESHVAKLSNQWSRTPLEARSRIANVEALLALATAYEDECMAARRPATVGGLLRWLNDLAAAGKDQRAVSSEDAVTVMTYHGAKGLEWPVTVLAGLNDGARHELWGVRARTNGPFDAQQPLLNRFVHHWPNAYGPHFSAPQAAVNAESSEIGQQMVKAGVDENKRLFYVGMTRPRDALILMAGQRKSGPARKWVDELQASALLFGDSGTVALPGGKQLVRATLKLSAAQCVEDPPAPPSVKRSWFTPEPLSGAQELWFRPSSAHGGDFVVAESQGVGTRIAIAGAVDMATLGTALHNCIACAGVAGEVRLADIDRVLERWEVTHAVSKDAVKAQVEALLGWVEKRWPGCAVHVEVPIEAKRPNGQRLRGRIDLLVDTPEGWVLIDHKSNPRGAANDEQLVNEHGPQLESYAEALRHATGRFVNEKWLFFPVSARAVRVQVSALANQ
ncbi:UvrD-helicase domain-containing protein [Variovorax ureilyticus]|uniref:DNA 3'-5' helicase n=1 Tax=Variovorax ureilyticus TaxID=1836198 RepID=A0ABU8VRG3_9BURK